MIERGIDPTGRTVARVLKLAGKYGFEIEDDDRDKDLLPRDYVFLEPEEKKEEAKYDDEGDDDIEEDEDDEDED